MRRLAGLALALALLTIGLATVALVATPASSASSGSSARPPAPKGGAGVTVDVKIGDNYFKPKKLTVLPGTIVRWVNQGRNEHDVIPNKGDRFGIDELVPDAEYSATFDAPGRFAYYCSFHGAPGIGQHATIRVVREPRPAP